MELGEGKHHRLCLVVHQSNFKVNVFPTKRRMMRLYEFEWKTFSSRFAQLGIQDSGIICFTLILCVTLSSPSFQVFKDSLVWAAEIPVR